AGRHPWAGVEAAPVHRAQLPMPAEGTHRTGGPREPCHALDGHASARHRRRTTGAKHSGRDGPAPPARGNLVGLAPTRQRGRPHAGGFCAHFAGTQRLAFGGAGSVVEAHDPSSLDAFGRAVTGAFEPPAAAAPLPFPAPLSAALSAPPLSGAAFSGAAFSGAAFSGAFSGAFSDGCGIAPAAAALALLSFSFSRSFSRARHFWTLLLWSFSVSEKMC